MINRIKSNNDRSILWKWTLSYLCLLFVPVLTIFINYFINLSALKKEYTHAYQLTLQNFETILNDKTATMQNFCYYIANLDSFNNIIKYNTKNKYFHNESYLLQQELSQNKYSNDNLNCTIYLSQVDFIAASDNSCQSLLFHNTLQNSSGLIPEFKKWQAFMSGYYTEDYFINTYLSDTNSSCLIYAHTLFRGLKGPVTIFISTPLNELFAATANLPSGVSLILQTADNMLFRFDNQGISSVNEEIFLDNNTIMITTKNLITNRLSLNENEITCYLSVSEETFQKNMHNIRISFITSTVFTIFIAIAVMFYLLNSNYRPVTKLLAEFDLKNCNGNEFSEISSSYKKLHKNFMSSNLTIHQQKQEIVSSKLLAILKGRFNELDIQKFMNDYKININNNCFLIGFMLSPTSAQDIEYDNSIYLITNNIFSDLFKNDFFYHIEDGRFIYYLFLFENDDTEAWYDDACGKLDYLCNFVNENFSSNIVASISESGENLTRCKFLYKKIMEIFELQQMVGGTGFINELSQNILASCDTIQENVNTQIIEAITSGNQTEVLSISDHLFSYIRKMPFSSIKTIIFNIFCNIIKLYNTYTADSIQQMHALNFISSIMQSESFDELSFSFNEFIRFICDEISRNQQNEGKEIILDIKNIVMNNYNNQNLSVGYIANNLGRNSKYISRLFKEGTGIGLLDYINQYRICEAQKIMNSENYSLEMITDMVGYCNVQTFRRSFVKFTGKNPSEFCK